MAITHVNLQKKEYTAKDIEDLIESDGGGPLRQKIIIGMKYSDMYLLHDCYQGGWRFINLENPQTYVSEGLNFVSDLDGVWVLDDINDLADFIRERRK